MRGRRAGKLLNFRPDEVSAGDKVDKTQLPLHEDMAQPLEQTMKESARFQCRTPWFVLVMALVLVGEGCTRERDNREGSTQNRSPENSENDSLIALLRVLGHGLTIEGVTIDNEAGMRIEYCPDNTCDSFSSGVNSTTDVLDFALLYLLFVSDHFTIQEIRSTSEAQAALKVALDRARNEGCDSGEEELVAQCRLRTLAERSQIKITFVRYDEMQRNEVPQNLEDELRRLRR